MYDLEEGEDNDGACANYHESEQLNLNSILNPSHVVECCRNDLPLTDIHTPIIVSYTPILKILIYLKYNFTNSISILFHYLNVISIFLFILYVEKMQPKRRSSTRLPVREILATTPSAQQSGLYNNDKTQDPQA